MTEATSEQVIAAIGALPLDTSIVESKAGEFTLQQRVPLDATPETLWAYLTEPDKLASWSPIVPDRPLTSEGPAESRENGDTDPVDTTVLRVIPNRELTHRWGEGEMTWRLEPNEQGTEVSVEQGFSLREEAVMTAAGWHICFAILALTLGGESVSRVVGTDAMAAGWESLRDRYAAM